MDVVPQGSVARRSNSGEPEKVYEFADSDVRIDYPVWSPDGNWVRSTVFQATGGDIWAMTGVDDWKGGSVPGGQR